MTMFRNILAAVDLGDQETSTKVITGAMEVFTKGDTLHVITVVPDYGLSIVGTFFPKGHESQLIEHAQTELHAFTAKTVPEGTPLQHVIAHGSIYEEIIRAANNLKVDLIVMGSHRPALQDYLLGPNAARVMRHADQSVLVVRS
ncbi:universal stress protein [Hoeflea sp. CAU 1731]